MTIVWSDGWDAYGAISGTAVSVFTKYQGVAGSMALAAGRYGGQALSIAAGNTNSMYNTVNFVSSPSSFTFCAQIKTSSLDSDPAIAFLASDLTRMIAMRFNTDGSIGVYRGATLVWATAPGVIANGTWYTLEFECVISDTVGRVSLYIDGATVINSTAQDTRNGTPTTISKIQWNPDATSLGGMLWDDCYIIDSATKPSVVYIIETISVDADSTPLDWTPSTGVNHYACVDEIPASAVDYLSASVVGNTDKLGVGVMSGTPISILGVNFSGFFAKTDAANRACQLDITSGATNSAGSSTFLSSTGVKIERILDNDPNTAAAWTRANIEASFMLPKVSV